MKFETVEKIVLYVFWFWFLGYIFTFLIGAMAFSLGLSGMNSFIFQLGEFPLIIVFTFYLTKISLNGELMRKWKRYLWKRWEAEYVKRERMQKEKGKEGREQWKRPL